MYRTLEEDLMLLHERAKECAVLSINTILKIFAEKGDVLILIFLALPFCQPLQIPGTSTPFGIVIFFMGIQIARKKPLWLPKRILTKQIETRLIQKILKMGLKVVRKLQYLLRMRMVWMCRPPLARIANGLVIAVLGILLALPLPVPLSNVAAAWSLLLICLGLSADDGLSILIGYLCAALTVCFFVFILISLKWFIHWI